MYGGFVLLVHPLLVYIVCFQIYWTKLKFIYVLIRYAQTNVNHFTLQFL